MKKTQKLLVVYLLLWNYIPFVAGQITGYKELSDGIVIELLADKESLWPCSDDNTIYVIGKLFTFKYQYISNGGEASFFIPVTGQKRWQFVPVDVDTAVCFFALRIPTKQEMKHSELPKYQTPIEYSYMNRHGVPLKMRAFTGVVENQKNVWIHPPRELLFRILELNPFPYVKFPYKVGKTWKWKLEIGDYWADERWKTWKGTITNKYVYTIADTACQLSTALGDLTCCKINSKATSKLGKTFLTAYFHPVYGFVRLEYINIDKSTLTIDMIKVE
jgi:hypothetical protein